MKILDWFRRSDPTEASAVPAVRAMAGESAEFFGMDDPRFLEFIRGGGSAMTQAGISITPKVAMRNPTVIRCVSLISFAIGMLPFYLQNKETKEKATDHPLYRVLHRRPNAWQTAFEFRSLMQQSALGARGDGTKGDAYAVIVRSGNRIIQLVPLDPDKVTPRQKTDWSLEYVYQKPTGGSVVLPQRDVFHLRYGLSEDGITGLSLVKQAAEAIALAIQTDKAAARLFKQGMLSGGNLKHPAKLSPEAYERLKQSMAEREGADNAYKWIITEEGMEATPFSQTGQGSQHVEQRKYQVEDISRPFGVPRPLLNLDETNWGSGIDVLGQFFVRYALNPWFEAWQQAVERMLSDDDAELYEAKFNPGGLLRGSMKEQGEFFAKGLGSGGQHPFLEVDEVRDWLDLPHSDNLPPPMGSAAPPQKPGDGNEPPEAS